MIKIGIFIKFYTPRQILLASLPILSTIVLLEALVIDGLVGGVFISITAYDFYLRINRVNTSLKEVTQPTKSLLFDNYQAIRQYIRDHNNLCNKLIKLSDFWKYLYLIFLLTVFPLTLVLCHQIMFEVMEIEIRIVFTLTNLAFYSGLFVIQCFLASLSTKMHKMCKTLSRIQWTLNSKQIDLRFKLKVMTYFERLASSQRIGFSIGSLTVVTFPLFAGVSMHNLLPFIL